MTSNAHSAYQQIEVNSSNSLQLVVMLYDGAIRFLRQAKACIQNKDLPGKTLAIDRALAILGELRSTLSIEEGGEIAKSLDKLYPYISGRILEASARLTVVQLDEAIRLLGILNSAWTEIAQRDQNREKMPPLPKPAAAGLSTNSGQRSSLEIFG